MSAYRIERIVSGNRAAAQQLFSTMAKVFEEESGDLSDAYIEQLLARPEFWALAAMAGNEIVGGLTAHTLPMTRSECSEIFIYDIAVCADHQRRGVGKLLMSHLMQIAGAAGIHDLFVPADNEDVHAVDFYRAIGGRESPVTFFDFGGEK